MRVPPTLAASLLLVSCSGGAKVMAPTYVLPGALAPFQGRAGKVLDAQGRPLLHLYLAVASPSINDIKVMDPEDRNPVLGPSLVFPLSVPFLQPTRLAAAPLGDGGADLLAVAGPSSLRVGIVDTWSGAPRVDPALSLDLAQEGIAPDAAIICLTAMRVPGATRARVLVGLSTRQLVAIDYDRAGDGLVLASPAVQVGTLETASGLTFEPRDLAVEPGGWRVFVATGDALRDRNGLAIQGVAQVDLSITPWAMVGLDARAPTRLVAAARLAERTVASSWALAPAPELRVAAALDEIGCGLEFDIDCGIVTLAPDDAARSGGIAADPVGELDHRAPIRLSGYPVDLAVAMPRAYGQGDDPDPTKIVPPADRSAVPLMTVATAGGGRQTTALLAVASSFGVIHMVDLARWAGLNEYSYFFSINRASVVLSANAPATPVSGQPVFGIWNDVSLYGPGLAPGSTLPDPIPATAAAQTSEIAFTPGYLPSDTWTVHWHGLLPGLGPRLGVLQRDAGGRITVAIQAADESGRWTAAARISDPALGARKLDRVSVSCTDAAALELDRFRAAVVDFVAPDPVLFPGGALVIDGAGTGACLWTAASPRFSTIEVRAQGLVLAGSAFGYAGRPALSASLGATGEAFSLAWSSESALRQIIANPATAPDDVRLAQEQLAVVRKLRRRSYPADPVCGDALTSNGTEYKFLCDQVALFPNGPDPTLPGDTRPHYDPLSTGPTLRFRMGIVCAKATATAAADTSSCIPSPPGSATGIDDPASPTYHDLATGPYGIIFTTYDGLWQSSRQSPVATSTPTGVAAVDPSLYPAHNRSTEILGVFQANEVLNYAPLDGSTVSVH